MPSFNPIEWLCLQRLFFKTPKKGLEQIRKGFILQSNSLKESAKDLEYLVKLGIEMIPYDSHRYPSLLKHIFDPPLLLLAKGVWPDWEAKRWVAVVGARKASRWGREKTREIVKDLVSEGIGVISGLAYGIDSEAHRACVEAGGVTWGVLGSGVDRIYPPAHAGLAEKMAQTGGYLSEFPMGTGPERFHFPQRNRIVSGLSHAVVVVEAGLKSGSLITANFALEQGREVFTVVPPKENVAYEGNQKLLESGCLPYENAKRVLREIRTLQTVRRSKTDHGPLTIDHGPSNFAQLLTHLKKPRTLDYLAKMTQKPAPVLLSELLQLEAEGLVKKIPGALWQSL